MSDGGSIAIRERLRGVSLRPTRQRIALGRLLFAKGDRHVTVEQLHEEVLAAGVTLSLATVYNTLHQFTEAGLVRVLTVESSKTYFDTNVSDHHHFFVVGANEIQDIPFSKVTFENLPMIPDGLEVAHVDVVIRLRRRAS
ncbi:iron response transcriptional regulator IrrA [Rhizobium sp. 2YAF20]|uniref:iron response transcriptional regulator IrrA n=1 Tax=Rhizobium sp. 2YAF20 TaxID=3233027 RepID=UPI003F9EAEBE